MTNYNEAVEKEVKATLRGTEDSFIIKGSELKFVSVMTTKFGEEVRFFLNYADQRKILIDMGELHKALRKTTFLIKKARTRYFATVIDEKEE